MIRRHVSYPLVPADVPYLNVAVRRITWTLAVGRLTATVQWQARPVTPEAFRTGTRSSASPAQVLEITS